MSIGKYVTDAKRFSIKPEGFDELTTLFINGKHIDTNRLKELTEKVFSSFEKILDEKQIFPYGVDIKELIT